MKKHIVLTLLSIFLCASLRAELKFDQNVVELHPGVGDKEAVGHFKYENTGKTPIHFKSVKTSCGCTVAQSQKEEVKPGEKGEITATFKIGDHTGMQVKTVTVETDQSPSAPVILTLRAVLPEMITLNPTFVYWTAGEEPKPKTIMAKAGKDFAAKNLTVTSSNPEFLTKVEPAGDGQWKINVEPKSTARALATSLSVRSDFPKDAPKTFFANASVTGAPVQQPAVPAQAPATALVAPSPATK
jgi:hypothetical protein